MGDATGQLAERLHLLALAKLLLRGLQVGDVARLEQQVDDLAVGARGPAGPRRRGKRSATPSAPSALPALKNSPAAAGFTARLISAMCWRVQAASVGASHTLLPDRLARVLRAATPLPCG